MKIKMKTKTIAMPLKVKDRQLWKNYNKILKKIEKLMNIILTADLPMAIMINA